MIQFVLILHLVVTVSLIALVLLQQGKGASMGAAFGSGASSTVFGSRGSGGFLFRLTAGLALAFFVTSLSLTYLASHSSKSLNDGLTSLVNNAPSRVKKTEVATGQADQDQDNSDPV